MNTEAFTKLLDKEKEASAELNALNREHDDLVRTMGGLEKEKLVLEAESSRANELIRQINNALPVS